MADDAPSDQTLAIGRVTRDEVDEAAAILALAFADEKMGSSSAERAKLLDSFRKTRGRTPSQSATPGLEARRKETSGGSRRPLPPRFREFPITRGDRERLEPPPIVYHVSVEIGSRFKGPRLRCQSHHCAAFAAGDAPVQKRRAARRK